MGKSRTLAGTVSNGGPLVDGVIGISDVTGLQAALDARALVRLATVNVANAAEAEFDGFFTSDYDVYEIAMTGVEAVTTSLNPLNCRFKVGGSYASSNYQYHVQTQTPGSATYGSTISSNAAQMELSGGANFYYPGLLMRLFRPQASGVYKAARFEGSRVDKATGNMGWLQGGVGWQGGTGAVTAIKFFFNTGNISAGTFALYGLAKS